MVLFISWFCGAFSPIISFLYHRDLKNLSNEKIQKQEGLLSFARSLSLSQVLVVSFFLCVGLSVSLLDDSLYKWEVHLFDFPDDCGLFGDLKQLNQSKNQDYVELQILFSNDYPGRPDTACCPALASFCVLLLF